MLSISKWPKRMYSISFESPQRYQLTGFQVKSITALLSSVLKVYLLKIMGGIFIGGTIFIFEIVCLILLKQVLCFQDVFQNILSCGILWSFSWNGISTSFTNFGWAKTSQNGWRSPEVKCRTLSQCLIWKKNRIGHYNKKKQGQKAFKNSLQISVMT